MARKEALAEEVQCTQRLQSCGDDEDKLKLRILVNAYSALGEAHAALAHGCIVALTVTSTHFEFMMNELSLTARSLQQKLEKSWLVDLQSITPRQAVLHVHTLRSRVRNFLSAAEVDVDLASRAAEETSSDSKQELPSIVYKATQHVNEFGNRVRRNASLESDHVRSLVWPNGDLYAYSYLLLCMHFVVVCSNNFILVRRVNFVHRHLTHKPYSVEASY